MAFLAAAECTKIGYTEQFAFLYQHIN